MTFQRSQTMATDITAVSFDPDSRRPSATGWPSRAAEANASRRGSEGTLVDDLAAMANAKESKSTVWSRTFSRSKEVGLPMVDTMDTTVSTAQPADKGDARPWWHPIPVFLTLVENWFLIGFGVLIVLAWAFPDVGKERGIIRSEYTVSYGCIALIFLITGLTLSNSALLHQLKNWKSHLFTQTFSLLFFPAIMFAIVNIVRATEDKHIDDWILVGLMMMAVLPTTVAANVTMTREAKGNEETAIAECCIGQILGIFLSPLILQAFMTAPGWSYGQPVAEGGQSSTEGLKKIYSQVGQHMGLAIFLPMFVGQIVQVVFPKQTKSVATTLRLSKVGSFLLLILIWSIFSTQFSQDAFNLVPPGSILLVVFLNLALYLIFTVLCVVLTRLPFIPPNPTKPQLESLHPCDRSHPVDADGRRIPLWRQVAYAARFDKGEATAICFCAAAKGLVVGSPILRILYGGLPAEQRAIISIPLVLYQGEQIACGQLLTYLFRRWNDAPDELKPEPE